MFPVLPAAGSSLALMLRGRERSCSNSVLKIMSWEQAHEIFFFFFHFHLRFVLTEDAKCLIHERIHRTRSKDAVKGRRSAGEQLQASSSAFCHPQRSKVNLEKRTKTSLLLVDPGPRMMVEEQVVTDVGQLTELTPAGSESLNGTAL